MTDQKAFARQIAEFFPLQGRWTEQDYFNLPDAMRIVELAGGELVMPPPPSLDHQDAVLALGAMLRQYVAEQKLGRAFVAPLSVHLEKDLIREPDVLFVSRENVSRLSQRGIDGPPDWVAEVLSPGTRATDEGDKLVEYERTGVGEYWILDPDARTVRVYVLREGKYAPPEQFEAGQQVASTVIEGFRVAVDDVL